MNKDAVKENYLTGISLELAGYSNMSFFTSNSSVSPCYSRLCDSLYSTNVSWLDASDGNNTVLCILCFAKSTRRNFALLLRETHKESELY